MEIRGEFNKLRLAPWDELNIISLRVRLRLMFERLIDSAEQCYLRSLNTARDDLLQDLIEFNALSPDDPWIDSTRKYTTEEWLKDQLESYHRTTRYVFYEEAERKMLRLQEAILTGVHFSDKGMVDKAIGETQKLWETQVSQHQIEVVNELRNQMMADLGVEWVQLESQRDGKVCAECQELEGSIYPRGKDPLPLHYNCRCFVVSYIK